MAKKVTKRKKTTTKKKKKKSGKIIDKTLFWCILIGFAASIAIIVAVEYRMRNAPVDITVKECDLCKHASAPIDSTTRFRDKNALHWEHATRNGLSRPFKDKADLESNIDSCLNNGFLVPIKANRYYVIKELTHSHPYLTPEAAKLLNEIGVRFQEKLREKQLGNYKFLITSMLRTEEDQKKLTRVNRNATPNGTAHYFGTTFDIGYYKYEKNQICESNPQVEEIFKETLREMRKQCRFLIICEGRSKCFHMTVTKCR